MGSVSYRFSMSDAKPYEKANKKKKREGKSD
jgi:hypothetical protein